ENVFDAQDAQVGDAQGERERGIVLAALDGVHPLAGNDAPLRGDEVRLVPRGAQNLKGMLHSSPPGRARRLGPAFLASRPAAATATTRQPGTCGASPNVSRKPQQDPAASTRPRPPSDPSMAL